MILGRIMGEKAVTWLGSIQNAVVLESIPGKNSFGSRMQQEIPLVFPYHAQTYLYAINWDYLSLLHTTDASFLQPLFSQEYLYLHYVYLWLLFFPVVFSTQPQNLTPRQPFCTLGIIRRVREFFLRLLRRKNINWGLCTSVTDIFFRLVPLEVNSFCRVECVPLSTLYLNGAGFALVPCF